MKKYSVYILMISSLILLTMSGFLYQQRNNFELHFETMNEKKPLDMSKLKGLTANLEVSLGNYVWHAEINEDQIKTSYQGDANNASLSGPLLTVENRLNPDIVKEHMEDITCTYDITGQNHCMLEIMTNEIEYDLIFYDGDGSRETIATSILKAIDATTNIYVVIDNPGEDSEQLRYDYEKNIELNLYDGNENMHVIQNDIFSKTLDSPFIKIRDYPTFSASLFEIENDLSGIYKIEDGRVKRIIETDFFQDNLDILLQTNDHLIVLNERIASLPVIQSYDHNGNLEKTFPQDYKGIKGVSVGDNTIFIFDEDEDADYRNNIHVLRYSDEELQEIDTFNDLSLNTSSDIRYYDHRLFQTTLGTTELTIYEGNESVFQGKITGDLLDSNSLFRSVHGSNNEAVPSFWDYYMKADNNVSMSLQLSQFKD